MYRENKIKITVSETMPGEIISKFIFNPNIEVASANGTLVAWIKNLDDPLLLLQFEALGYLTIGWPTTAPIAYAVSDTTKSNFTSLDGKKYTIGKEAFKEKKQALITGLSREMFIPSKKVLDKTTKTTIIKWLKTNGVDMDFKEHKDILVNSIPDAINNLINQLAG